MNNSQLIEALDIVNGTIASIISVVSALGVLFNAYSLCLLLNKKLKFKFYDFFRCRCICNLVVCFVGTFTKAVYYRTSKNNYWSVYFQIFVFAIPLRIALMSTFISDILLILNRITLLFGKKMSIFYRLSKKVSTVYSFLFRKFSFNLSSVLLF